MKVNIIHGATTHQNCKFDAGYTCQDILDDVKDLFGIDPASRALVNGENVNMTFVPSDGDVVEFQKATGQKA